METKDVIPADCLCVNVKDNVSGVEGKCHYIGKNRCKHYARRCHIICNVCNKGYPCHVCHDEEWDNSNEKKHCLKRKKVEYIVCTNCWEQQSPSGNCIKCGIKFADFYCEICKIWDDHAKRKEIYHCDGCGLCRVGGQRNFFHCYVCCGCYPEYTREYHICIPNVMKEDCPICLQDMFHSRISVLILRCGHVLHQDCILSWSKFKGFLECPLCRR